MPTSAVVITLRSRSSGRSCGVARLGEIIAETCRLARVLEARVACEPRLELLAPVALNIVCFRVRHEDLAVADRINRDIVIDLQQSGVAAPSTTRIDGKLAIRVAIVNHRCRECDLELVIDAILDRAPRRDARLLGARFQHDGGRLLYFVVSRCVKPASDQPAG